jgi:glycosyltransferase involved in cell wall biosynthesis
MSALCVRHVWRPTSDSATALRQAPRAHAILRGKTMTNKECAIDASSLSLVFPVRVDGQDRLENLATSSRYVRQFLRGAELVLVECDDETRVSDEVKARFDRVIFIKSIDAFSKSECMNTGLLQCTRPVVGFYDVDVLVHPAAMEWAIDKIQTGHYPLVLPFNGVFVDITGACRRDVIKRLAVGSLVHDAVSAINLRPDSSARIVDGGVFVADREVMTMEGGYNVKMVSYGWEDIEVLLRLEKLGYYRDYAPYNLVHLDHSRGPDSVRNEHFDLNEAEYRKVRAMSRRSLRRYVDEDLRIVTGAKAARQRRDLRRRKSRGLLSRSGIGALIGKVRSRLSHR